MSQPYSQWTEPAASESEPGELLEQPALEGPGLVDPLRPAKRSEASPPRRQGASTDLVQPRHLVAARRELDWRQRAPRWTAAVLAGIVVAELVQTAWVLRAIAMQPLPAPPGDLKARPRSIHWWRLAGAHLFGVEEQSGEAAAAQTRAPPITWLLSAVMATSDPSQGFAILGEQGKILKVLRPGAPLDAVPGGRLAQVFADHVVLDLQGRMETVSLPKQLGSYSVPARLAAVASPVRAAAADPVEAPAGVQVGGPRVAPSAAENVFRSLSPELAGFNGTVSGIKLHPGKPLQRMYGFRDGDVLTAINGVEITGPGALAAALKSSTGDSIAITYVRDGVTETVNMPLGN